MQRISVMHIQDTSVVMSNMFNNYRGRSYYKNSANNNNNHDKKI